MTTQVVRNVGLLFSSMKWLSFMQKLDRGPEFLLKRLPADTAFELMLNWDKHKEAKHLNFNIQWSRRLYFELARGLIAASSQEKSWRKNICKMDSGLLWEGVLSFLSPNKTWTLLLCSLAARQRSPVSGCQVLRVQFGTRKWQQIADRWLKELLNSPVVHSLHSAQQPDLKLCLLSPEDTKSSNNR